jgi:nucleotide-binding universal stress UspA family protein
MPHQTEGAGQPIVVGVEGAEPGFAATRWAAIEAGLRHLPLRVVHTYQRPARAWRAESASVARHDAEAIVAAALNVARTEAPLIEITGRAQASPAAQALIDLSETASLVVVGHRGHGCGSTLRDLRSPVASKVTAHARSPVAVVRPGSVPPTGDRRIVVGVDGSTAAEVALGFAFEEASLRQVPLEVVRAWTPSGPRGGTVKPSDLDGLDQELHDWVRPWRDAYPRLLVTLMVAPAHPILVLTQASQDAGLLVVGARGAGGFPRLPVGSVSQQLIHLAACPVVVIRPAQQPDQPGSMPKAGAGR